MADRTPNRTPNRTPCCGRDASQQPTHSSPCKQEATTTPTKKTPTTTPLRSAKESPALYRNFWLCPRTAPRRGPTTAQFHTARQRVEGWELDLGEVDAALAREIALLLHYVPANLPSNSTYVDVALRHCFNSLGLTHHDPKSFYDMDYYADPDGLDGPNNLKLPVFWMNSMNAPGIESTYPGTHGFGWVLTAECPLLDHTGPFHLVNALGRQGQWRYCGKYYAHRTELAMTRDGWKALPEDIREAAALLCAGRRSPSAGKDEETCTDEETYDLLKFRPELVVFQFCGMPSREFLGRLKESAALFVNPPCTPENKHARERISATHPDSIEDFVRIQQRSGRTE